MPKTQFTQKDRSILRRLAESQAAIAADPIHQTTIAQWKRMNRLDRGKPMIWINEICWPELDKEMPLETQDSFCRDLEQQFRRRLYQWDHIRGDMVVEPKFYCPVVIGPRKNLQSDAGDDADGFGMKVKERTIAQGAAAYVYSHQYEPVIKEEADIDKIQMSQVIPDWDATEEKCQRMVDLFGDILPVEKTTRSTWWFAPWDWLVQWWGVEQALVDLTMRPELVHRAMDRLVNAYLHILDQYEEQNLLSLNNNNVRIGSGGLGFTDQLPKKKFDAKRVRVKDLWGCATAQIFAAVSPEMHWEFALQYEKRWLDRFGLTYYGCCEPLHNKMGILKKIPNLRRVSISPQADIEKGAQALGRDYIFSMKPNPAILASDSWNPQAARAQLRSALEKTRGCVVEIILKDISTVRNAPRRLWEWEQIAKEVSAEFA